MAFPQNLRVLEFTELIGGHELVQIAMFNSSVIDENTVKAIVGHYGSTAYQKDIVFMSVEQYENLKDVCIPTQESTPSDELLKDISIEQKEQM